MAKKRERPEIIPKDELEKQEEILKQLQVEQLETTPVADKKKTIRFTMDLPVDLHKKINDRIARSGQTMKGYFLSLTLEDLED